MTAVVKDNVKSVLHIVFAHIATENMHRTLHHLHAMKPNCAPFSVYILGKRVRYEYSLIWLFELLYFTLFIFYCYI